MTDLSLSDRYLALIDQIVDTTLKGKIRSQAQVYDMLVQGVSVGTGEIFERALDERTNSTQQVLDTIKDELKQAKATRTLRALKTIKTEWQRWQEQNKVTAAIATSQQQIINAETNERLNAFLRVIDPNQKQFLSLDQLKQLAKSLQQHSPADSEITEIALGITRGLESWQRLEDYLISWIYEQQGPLGFTGTPEQSGPWSLWAKKVNSRFPQSLFNTLSLGHSPVELVAHQTDLEIADWIEVALILQYLQRGLVTWFEKQAYDPKVGPKAAISTFLSFAVIWGELANGFNSNRLVPTTSAAYANGCFQVTLQILRAFSQKEYFPLYGGIFTSFTGNYLRDTLNYLDEPLRQVEGTQEKARILTLLGYSEKARGRYDRANSFHQQAVEIARNASDHICEIANLNHLSRMCVAQKNYEEAINYSQRALILARQTGDKLGESNALANLGYSEVFSAQQLENIEPEVYETAINYLQQGWQLSERLGDSQSKSLCGSSLGIAYVLIQEYQQAIAYLQSGLQAAQFSGDLYLQGLNLAYLSQAYYNLSNHEQAILAGGLGMYLLAQISANEWRQTAGLLLILQGQIGADNFQELLKQQRSKIIPFIGVDGYDHIPQLLAEYKN